MADFSVPLQFATDLRQLNETEKGDLVAQFRCPVVLVARSGLGTINHTLLSLGVLREKDIESVLVVLNGPLNVENKLVIENFAPGVKILSSLY